MSKSILDEWWRSTLISICSNGCCFEHLAQFDRFLGGGRVASDKLKTVWFACIWMIWKARNGHVLKKNVLVWNLWLVRLSCCHGNGLKAMLGDLCGLLVNSSRFCLMYYHRKLVCWYWNFLGSAVKTQTGSNLIESSFFA